MTTLYQQLPMFTVATTGETTLLRVAPALTELDLMAADLINYRLADADDEQPFARLTDEQVNDIEVERDESIGDDFSRNPFYY